MIIAIDGPAAAGKGTLAQNLARRFGYAFLDTGRLYRAVGYAVLRAGKDPSDATAATAAAEELTPENVNKLLKNPALREEATGAAASKVAVIPSVRTALLDLQRRFAKQPFFEDGSPAAGAVLDGRDIGTVVCPDADVKLFVTASAEVRADRRFKELKEKGEDVSYDVILKDLKERDERDSKRATAPLKPAEDAFILDTSDMDADKAFASAMEYISSRG